MRTDVKMTLSISSEFNILAINLTNKVKDWSFSSDESESQIDLKELQRRIRHVTSIKEKNVSGKVCFIPYLAHVF